MRITIAAIGRERSGPFRSLLDTYLSRCPWQVELIELPLSTAPAADQRRRQETLKLAHAVRGHDRLISLDPNGKVLDSESLASTLGTWREEGARTGILIGGPDGLEPAAFPRLDLALAFGRMTWPHQLVRVMLAEQLYRASAILAGHPYHRG